MATPPDAPDTAELLLRTKAGDLDAFGRIVCRYERLLRGWLAVRCPPGADADDLAQTTFLEAFRRLDEFALGTEFGAWLFTIARYQLLAESTRLRRVADYHTRYVPFALAEELARRAEADGTPEDVERLLEHLRTCVAELPAADRRLLADRYTRNTPLAAVAARLGRTVGAVKKHLFVLRQRLHDCVARKLASAEGAG
jgi:RNA polymerase sigma-70 factor, ECF subfamily